MCCYIFLTQLDHKGVLFLDTFIIAMQDFKKIKKLMGLP